MLKEQIEELIKKEDYEEIEKLVNKSDIKEMADAISKMNTDLLLQLLPKISPEESAKLFLMVSTDTQLAILKDLSYVEFKPIANELLDLDVENMINEEVFNEIMLKAKAEDRNEKLAEIINKLENKEFASLKPILSELEPVDIAEIFEEVDDSKLALIFRLLPKDLASDVFVEMNPDDQEILIASLTDKELEFVINDLFVDDTVDIIEDMPANVVSRILAVTKTDTRDTVNKLLRFPKDSAGSIMTTEFVYFKANTTVYEALRKIRKNAVDKETIYTCYIIDDERHLLGIVTAKDLILHEPTDIVSTFMEENIIYATTRTDKEEVAALLSKYDLIAIPIVDDENRINGIVTIDDAIDVIQEEATEDISKLHGVTPTSKPYLQTSVWKIYLARLPWLLILLVSATFTALIINKYENQLSAISAVLIASLPMLMDAGGNAGSQASVTIIRSLSLGEVDFKDILKVLWKEIRVAIILALSLAVACFIKLMVIDGLLFHNEGYTAARCAVISLALFCTICIAKIVGCCLPLFAKKAKLDSAVVASPFITTIVDAISLLVFCGIALALL